MLQANTQWEKFSDVFLFHDHNWRQVHFMSVKIWVAN